MLGIKKQSGDERNHIFLYYVPHPILCFLFCFVSVAYMYHSIFLCTFCFVSSHTMQLCSSCGFVLLLLQLSF